MASTIYAVECANCQRSAIADEYSATNEVIITCFRCGYNYSKKIQKIGNGPVQYKEETYGGFGIFKLVTRFGDTILGQFRNPMTQEQFNHFKEDYFNEKMNREESFLVTYEDGECTIHYGKPTENFYLSFDQYKKKIFEKYGDKEIKKQMIPFEE